MDQTALPMGDSDEEIAMKAIVDYFEHWVDVARTALAKAQEALDRQLARQAQWVATGALTSIEALNVALHVDCAAIAVAQELITARESGWATRDNSPYVEARREGNAVRRWLRAQGYTEVLPPQE